MWWHTYFLLLKFQFVPTDRMGVGSGNAVATALVYGKMNAIEMYKIQNEMIKNCRGNVVT